MRIVSPPPASSGGGGEHWRRPSTRDSPAIPTSRKPRDVDVRRGSDVCRAAHLLQGTTMTLKAAFIGLGAMGAPMAGHLHAKGLLSAVGNRSQAKADALARELGVDAPDTASIAAS